MKGTVMRFGSSGRTRLCALLAAGVAAWSAPAAASPEAVSAEVPDLASMIETLASDEAAGRGAGTPELAAAGEAVLAWFAAASATEGVAPVRQEFSGANGESLFNVVATLPGSGPEWIVVGAHYDGLGRGLPGTDFAFQVMNGADDNASG
ncbi:MAG: M28 family peptidase, partial [Gemmatimonadetes bacterium]|nr:M28 family peptidase [Gemmatimonadota bacterium]